MFLIGFLQRTLASWTIVEGHVTKAIFFLLFFREPSFPHADLNSGQKKSIYAIVVAGPRKQL